MRFIIVSQGVPEKRDRDSSPLGISSSITLCKETRIRRPSMHL
jgi:hypothetical protein